MLHYYALLRVKFQSFLKRDDDEIDDHENGERDPNSNTETSASATSQLADQKEASMIILDHEAGLSPFQQQSAYNVYNGRTMISPSPSPSSSSSSSSPSIKYCKCQRSSSSHPLLPIINPNQNPNPSPNIPAPPDHDHDDQEGGGGGLHPIAQNFKDQDFGKTVFGLSITVVAAFVTPYAPISSLVRSLVFSSLCLGLTALFTGMMVRNYVVPIRYTIFIEQIGVLLVLLAVFGLFSSFLPLYLMWIPWACFLALLFIICCSFRLGN